MTKEHYIDKLKAIDRSKRFESTFLVQSKEVRSKKNGGDPYLVMRLADRTGVMDARMWDNVAAVAEVFEANDFVEVRGRVQDYNGQAQIIVGKLAVVPREQVDLDEFLPRTKGDVEKMFAEVLATVDGFSDPHLKALMGGIFRDKDIARRFKQAAAASGMHHAWVGGLLEHVVSCLRVGKLLSAHYAELDPDLLASGVLLHDFGKIFELSVTNSIEYTDEGRLLGHIAMGSAWLERRCDEIEGFPPNLKALLLHLVLSHHGKLEFGSPKVPLFPEALALHYIDDLDSRLEMMRAATAEVSGERVWTQFQRGLETYVLNKRAYLAKGAAGAAGEAAPNPAAPSKAAQTEPEPEPAAAAAESSGEAEGSPPLPPAADLFDGSGAPDENPN